MLQMNLQNDKTSLIILFFILSIIFSARSMSHVINENSARVIFREGQIEIQLQISIRRWVRELAYEYETPTSSSQNAFRVSADELRKILSEQLILNIDKHLVLMKVVSFPNLQESKDHEYAEIIMTGKHSVSSVSRFEISFPASLGSIHASFIKPKYKVMLKGEKALVNL